MESWITYREIGKSEEEKACRLVMDCFTEFVARGYSREGVIEFLKIRKSSRLCRNRLGNNHFIILAFDNDLLVGLIEVRNFNHISLFFVKTDYQNKGIGKKLHELAVNRCKLSSPDVSIIEVNSSPYAIPVYEKLGFVKVE